MKRKWMCCASILLCVIMMLSLCGTIGIASEPDTPYNEADAKPESGDLLTILKDDFEGHEAGQLLPLNLPMGFSGGAISAIARMYVEEENDSNQILKAYHGAPDAEGEGTRTPRIDRTIPLDRGIKTMTIDFDMKNSGGRTKFPAVFFVHETENSPTYASFMPSAATTEWVHVKIRCDLEAGTGKVYLDGRLYSEHEFDFRDATKFRLRINCSVATDGSWSAIDDIVVTTPDTDIAGIIGLDGVSINLGIMEEKTEKTGIADVMRMSHPRIYVTDWQKIHDKIETDEHARSWYDVLIQEADDMLQRDTIAYERNVRNNINECSTEFKASIIPLAAAYCLTKDIRYKDRVYLELENVGNWPDWGADAWLCTAHINYAFALCYDWLYNDWTEEERSNILGWLQEKGLREAVLAYEGYGSSCQWVTGADNWNNVCNGSNMVAALAVYEETPIIAEYIIRQAAESLPYSFQEITPDGAYAEPLVYWDYGVRHQVKAMAALDSCLKEGEVLPSVIDFTHVPGLDKTCDFPIYYNGVTGVFNYGDAAKEMVTSPIMYWFATKYNKPEYAWYNVTTRENNPFVTTMTGKDATLSLLWYDPTNVEANELPLDKFYQSTEQFGANGISMRSSFEDMDALVAMMHAGDQTAPHSSLDAGGFVLDWAGKRWVHMYGRTPVANIPGGTYSWPGYHTKSQTGGHYDYYHCRAEANNTIIANPKRNMPDMYYKYYAPVERCDSNADVAYGIVDMTETNADFETAKRGMMMTGERDIIVIQDEIEAKFASEYYWFANTNAEITIATDGKSALWKMGDDEMLVRITQGPEEAKFGIMSCTPLPTSPDPAIQPNIPGHKMYIHITGHETLNLTVEFVPLIEGERIPTSRPVVPLAQWNLDYGMEKLSQNITVPTISEKTYGDAPFSIAATPDAASGLTEITYSSSNTDVAEVSADGMITIKAAGTTNITVAQEGDDEYAAFSMTQGLKVNKKAVTVDSVDFDAKTAVLSGLLAEDTEIVLDFAKLEISIDGDASETAYNVTATNIVLSGTGTENYAVSTESVSGTATKTNVVAITATGENTAVTGAGVYYVGDAVTLVANVDRGYVFEGWFVGEEAISTNETYTFTAAEDVSLIAKAKRASHAGGASTKASVSFSTNGGNDIADMKVERGAKVSTLPLPTKEGYIFRGWYADEALTKPISENATITVKTTLYAAWEKVADPNVNNGVTGEKDEIVLVIGKKEASIWGEHKANDVAPKLVNSRTMLPIRMVAEALGAEVIWTEDEPDQVIIKNGEATITLEIGAAVATVNGEEFELDSPSFLENDRTYMPLRFISEALGAQVEWDEATQKVTIKK